MSLAVTPNGSSPSNRTSIVRALLHEALSRKHVLHLARADAEREGAEGTVGRGMRVAAHDRHTGLGGTELRADDMDDALVGRIEVEERQAECPRLPVRVRTCWAATGSAMGRCRSPVGTLWSTVASVRSGRRTWRPASLSPSKAWGEVTSCTRCRSMYSAGPPAIGVDDVGVPDLLEQGPRLAHQTVAGSRDFAAAALPSSLHGIMTRRARPVFSSR